MKKELIIIPDEWTCSLGSCPAGLFVYGDQLCFKSGYGNDELFLDSGEAFWGGTSDKKARNELIVQPVKAKWREVDE